MGSDQPEEPGSNPFHLDRGWHWYSGSGSLEQVGELKVLSKPGDRNSVVAKEVQLEQRQDVIKLLRKLWEPCAFIPRPAVC